MVSEILHIYFVGWWLWQLEGVVRLGGCVLDVSVGLPSVIESLPVLCLFS